jgi:hypothetical protein
MLTKILTITILILLTQSLPVQAGSCGSSIGCDGTNPWTAASASYADVNYCINKCATYGDVVNIPSGKETWKNEIIVKRDINIKGAGVDRTNVTAEFQNDRRYQAFFKFVPDAKARNNLSSLSNVNTFEVSGITFAGPSPRLPLKFGVWVYNIYTPSIRRVRIHNNKFISIHRAVQVKGYVHGVFDSNDLIDTNGSYPQGVGLAMFTNDVMTTGSGDGWYIEDNTFSFSSVGCVSGAANDGYGHIVRYNTVAGKLDFYVESHSNQLAYIKGGFFTEVYGNDFSASTRQGGIDMRGGKNIIFSNKMTNASPRVREEFEDAASGALPPNMAPSTKPQICTDDNICWKVNHSYFWNNRQSVTNAIIPFFVLYDRYDNVKNNNPPELVENREFWNKRPTGTFDGSGKPEHGGGVGCGTMDQMNAISPTTEGVGFWVTSQSCSDLTGMVGANPANPIKGTLYRNVSGTWKPYYTPYTYPHPLRTSF